MIKKVLSQLAFLVVTAILTVGLIEVGSRFLFPAWAPASGDRDFWTYDELLGWRHEPNAAGRFAYSDFDVHVQTNSDGHRDREYARSREPGRTRILLLGDSFGWGYGVEQDEIFAELIEARRSDVEIINTSVSGYGTDQEYLYYVDRGHEYDPDVVLLLFCANDIANSSAPVQYWHNKPMLAHEEGRLVPQNVPVPELSLTQEFANYIARNTYFLRIASQATAAGLAQLRSRGQDAAASEARPGEQREPKAEKRLPPAEEHILRIVLGLNEEVKARGSRLAVVALPGDFHVFEDERFRAAEIPHLSLTGLFKGSDEPMTFEHDPHWTPAGHRVVADAVERFLRESDLLPETPSSVPGHPVAEATDDVTPTSRSRAIAAP